MCKCLVKSVYHGNGKVNTELFIESEIENVVILDVDDIYYDYFDTREDADEFIEDCKTA